MFIFPLLMFCTVASLAHQNPAQSQLDENPPARAARISYLKGRVSFQPAGQDQWSEATLNFTVTSGDRIYTDKGARAELEVGPYTVRLSGNTDLTVTNLNDQIFQLALEQGTVRLSVYKLLPGNIVELDTPEGALTILEPGTYRADVNPDDQFTTVAVDRGKLEISGNGISQTLEAAQAIRLRESVQVESIPMPSHDSFDRWTEERDERLSASASAQYVSPQSPGYEELDTYGRWEEVADYGPVWYPSDLPPDWVPYRYGHWAWIGPWGWTWVEDEVWGFCPFHYGRWVLIGATWGWLPGPLVALPFYAPALVAFVGGPGLSVGVSVGGVALAAWFPLGPGEPFFPWYHCTAAYIQQVNITNIRNVTNITNITDITNIENVHYAYRTVAATAVPANVLQNGERVARHVVPLRPEQLQRAQVIPHPSIRPSVRAALPGRLVAPPPVRRQTFIASNRATLGTLREPPSTRNLKPTPPPVNARTRPAPPPTSRLAPRPSPPRVITRVAPPPTPVPFAQQRPPMMVHPGRPLEPQQLENLRAGRPPGPMLDHEFPPHAMPLPRPAPIPHPPVPAVPSGKPRRPPGANRLN